MEDLEQRIQREEVTLIYQIVKREIDDEYAIAYGSYRREKEAFGDMNILITKCDGKNTEDFLFNLIKQLEEKLLNYHFKMQNRTDHDCKTYMDIEKKYLIKLCLAGLIFKTVSKRTVWLCSFRHEIVGSKNGYTLSDHELYPNKKDVYKMKLWKEEVTLCEEEIDVYKILGLIYKPTKERSV